MRRGLEVPVPNDYLITNDYPQLRDYPISPDVLVTLTLRGPEPVEASLSELRVLQGELDADIRIPFDLVLEDGQVVEINQVYVP